MNARTISMHLLELHKTGQIAKNPHLRSQALQFLVDNASKIEPKNLVFSLQIMIQTRQGHQPINLAAFRPFILPLVDSPQTSVDLNTLHRLSTFCDELDQDLRDKLVKRVIIFQEKLHLGASKPGRCLEINALRQIVDMNSKLKDRKLTTLSGEMLTLFVAQDESKSKVAKGFEKTEGM